MKRSLLFSIVSIFIFVSLLTVQAAFADDHGESDLDPDANACFEGGTLEGQCHTEAMWEAGWILVRVEHGLIDPGDVPDEHDWIVSDHSSDGDSHEGDHEDEDCLEEDPGDTHEGDTHEV